jgi:hypothetical protein
VKERLRGVDGDSCRRSVEARKQGADWAIGMIVDFKLVERETAVVM